MIELLAVITITAVLAALIVPGFMRATDSARRATCLSNMRQIGLATVGYIGENGAFPQGQTPAGSPLGHSSFLGAIVPYTDEKFLPESDHNKTLKGFGHCPNHTENPFSYSYRANGWLISEAGVDPALRPVNVPSLSATVLLYEVHVISTTIPRDYYYTGTGKAPFTPLFTTPIAPHKGDQWNFLFADGHAESLTSAQLEGWIWPHFYVP